MVNRFLACLIFDPIGPLGSLSNFSKAPFDADGQNWMTVEHYYQSQKFTDERDRALIMNAKSAVEAKAIAWSLADDAPPRWYETAPSVIRRALSAKFGSSIELSAILTQTWPIPILEDSLTDDFWGIGHDGRGRNEMGLALGLVRDELIDDVSPFSRVEITERPLFCNRSRFDTVDGIIYYNGTVNAKDVLAQKNPLLIDVSHIQHCSDLESSPSMGNMPISVPAQDRSGAFESKYRDYHWVDDARSCFPTWASKAATFFDQNSEISDGSTLVLGAGVGDEVEMLWSHFEGRTITFSDISDGLCNNIRRSAAGQPCKQMFAEDLKDIPSSSLDTYIALRVYQSYGLDKEAGARECRRVLRQGGTAIISIANGYRDSEGSFVMGLINETGEIDPSLHLYQAGETVDAMVKAGFELIAVDNWQTELVLVFDIAQPSQ